MTTTITNNHISNLANSLSLPANANTWIHPLQAGTERTGICCITGNRPLSSASHYITALQTLAACELPADTTLGVSQAGQSTAQQNLPTFL